MKFHDRLKSMDRLYAFAGGSKRALEILNSGSPYDDMQIAFRQEFHIGLSLARNIISEYRENQTATKH